MLALQEILLYGISMSKAVVTVTGGSGSGKSTLLTNLCSKYPSMFTPFRLEDYYLPFDDIKIRYKGRANLDVEEAFDKEALTSDLDNWMQNKNSGDTLLFERFIANNIIQELPIKRIFSIYMEAPHRLRFGRRQGEMMDKDYERNVLIPMHNLHVEPQKGRADAVIDVSDKTIQEVESLAFKRINNFIKEQG